MELRQLRYFTRAAELLSFSEAARAVNIAQSSLSQQIRQLEDELGIPLFVRGAHSLTLTEAGAQLLPLAQRTLHDADTCALRIADLQQLRTGVLSVGVTYSFSSILTETVIAFMRLYPGIKLNIIYKPMLELMQLLRDRQIDFVLAFKPSQSMPDVESHILFQNVLAAVVAKNHPLASKQKLTLDELQRYDLALPARGLQARNAFELLAADREFKIRLEINDVNLLFDLVRQTSLVTVLAEDSAYSKRDIVTIPIDVPHGEMAGGVHVLRDSYHKEAMREFIRLLTESLAVKLRQNSWL